MTRDVLPRIGTGFQGFDSKAVTEVMQPRARRVGVPADACGLKEGVEGVGHRGIAQLGATSRNEDMIVTRLHPLPYAQVAIEGRPCGGMKGDQTPLAKLGLGDDQALWRDVCKA